MIEKTLVMGFLNELGKKVSLRLKDIKEELNPEEVGAVMDTIVSKNIFVTSGGKFAKKLEAQIVTEEVTPIELA